MKVYTVHAVCSVCGQDGVARPMDAAKTWRGGEMVHRDPAVCRENLRHQREVLEREKEQLAEAKRSGEDGS